MTDITKLARAKHLPRARDIGLTQAALQNTCTALNVTAHGTELQLIDKMLAQLASMKMTIVAASP